MRAGIGIGMALFCTAVCAAPAAATTRYVQHGGVGTGDCKTPATACNAPYVLGGATNSAHSQAGDTVIVLASGGALGLPETLQRKFILRGDPNVSTRPVITSATGGTTLAVDAAGSTVSDNVVTLGRLLGSLRTGKNYEYDLYLTTVGLLGHVDTAHKWLLSWTIAR